VVSVKLNLSEEQLVEHSDEEPEKKEPSLTDSELSILAYVEQIYWETGRIPTKEMVVEGLDPFGLKGAKNKVAQAWNKPRFQSALEKRGLNFQSDSKLLTPTQLLLVNMLLNVEDKKSLRQKLETLGINMAKYQTWLRDPAFHSYLTMRTEQLFENSDHDAYKSMIQAVMRGDTQAMKLFFEMRGIWSPKLEINVNIESVIYRVVEVVGKHVKDPLILNAIADEVEQLEIPRHASR
jgi:Helix-turn-helix of insertion element transposase